MLLALLRPGDHEAPVQELFAFPKAATDTIQGNTAIKCEKSESLAWAYIHGIEKRMVLLAKTNYLTWGKKGIEMFLQ